MSISRNIVFTALLSMLTAYAFVTGWAVVSGTRLAKMITGSASLMSLIIAIGAVFGGVKASATQSGMLNDLSPGAFYSIAAIAAFSWLLDVRYIFLIKPQLKTKLIRHTWRMGFSLFISSVIFFFGNNHVLPDHFRTSFYLSMPVILIAILTATYCLFITFISSWVSHKKSWLSRKE